MHPVQKRLLQEASTAKKLQLIEDMFQLAWQTKWSWFKEQNPDWSEDQIRQAVKECILSAGD